MVQQALAVLPAFASSVYYTAKASSSIAAALICGTPLLADDQLLAAYSYMPRNATFPQVPHSLPYHCYRAHILSLPDTIVS